MGEKTEKATPKKRRDAREKEGSVLQSKEVSTAVSLLGIFLALMVLAQFMLQIMLNAMVEWLDMLPNEIQFNGEFIQQNSVALTRYCVLIIGPILIVGIVVAVIPVIIQTRGMFNTKIIQPKFSKLNPITGFKRLFSIQSAVGVLKGIIEIAAIGVIVYFQIRGLITDIQKLPDMDLIQGVVFTAKNLINIILLICIIFAFIAAGDYLYQWWEFERKLKMSKQEIKDEYKQMEGDPLIKSKIKQKQREIAQQRMMEDVPQSDVVIANPTHCAVALKYDNKGGLSAPIVVAKGLDNIAQRIKEIAKENNIEIIEDRPLAWALHDNGKLGGAIPADLFRAVAAIYAELEAFKIKEPKRPSKYN
ncbi:MAG: flagellar biosynthesis protein FlhB [Oscillospiraceae bacterium]|jgi:flagellar biosynthetic protein FlhB|nr:flagellar biosynthesis protein FlhB [Oscillospiraceae bacterium]